MSSDTEEDEVHLNATVIAAVAKIQKEGLEVFTLKNLQKAKIFPARTKGEQQFEAWCRKKYFVSTSEGRFKVSPVTLRLIATARAAKEKEEKEKRAREQKQQEAFALIREIRMSVRGFRLDPGGNLRLWLAGPGKGRCKDMGALRRVLNVLTDGEFSYLDLQDEVYIIRAAAPKPSPNSSASRARFTGFGGAPHETEEQKRERLDRARAVSEAERVAEEKARRKDFMKLLGRTQDQQPLPVERLLTDGWEDALE